MDIRPILWDNGVLKESGRKFTCSSKFGPRSTLRPKGAT